MACEWFIRPRARGPFWRWNCWNGEHSGAKARGGDKTGARKDYQDFLALWKDADPDVPVLREARSEFEKLK